MQLWLSHPGSAPGLAASLGLLTGVSGTHPLGPYELSLLMGPKHGQDTTFHNSRISCWHLTKNLCICSFSMGNRGKMSSIIIQMTCCSNITTESYWDSSESQKLEILWDSLSLYTVTLSFLPTNFKIIFTTLQIRNISGNSYSFRTSLGWYSTTKYRCSATYLLTVFLIHGTFITQCWVTPCCGDLSCELRMLSSTPNFLQFHVGAMLPAIPKKSVFRH